MDESPLAKNEAKYRQLMREVTRLFYDLGEVLVMEALLLAPRQTPVDGGPSYPELQLDDKIAERLHLQEKQVRTLLTRLARDRLVIQCRKEKFAQQDAYGGKTVVPAAETVQCYYGLDYETASDAVRFKLNDMERILDAERHAVEQVSNLGMWRGLTRWQQMS